MKFDPDWTIGHAALEVARVAHEGLGSTKFEELKARFAQEIQQGSSDQEIQLRVAAQVLVKLTDARTGPKDTADVQVAGSCLMWLAQTRVRDWTLLELYNWVLQQGG